MAFLEAEAVQDEGNDFPNFLIIEGDGEMANIMSSQRVLAKMRGGH